MPEYAQKPSAKKKPSTNKTGTKKTGTPCERHPDGDRLIATWRPSGGMLPDKHWTYVNLASYDPDERACYSWLYEPSSDANDIDTNGMMMLRNLAVAGHDEKVAEFIREHISDDQLTEHLKPSNAVTSPISTVAPTDLNPYAADLAEVVREAVFDGKFMYANELLSTVITALIVQLIKVSREVPAFAASNSKGGSPPSSDSVGAARDELNLAARPLRAIVALYPRMIQEYRSKGDVMKVGRVREGWEDLKQRIEQFAVYFHATP